MLSVPGLIGRNRWKAAAVRGEFEPHTIERVTVHHTAVAFDGRATALRLRAYQRYHQGMGWPDVAYHLLIGGDGVPYEGRPFEACGDSATDYDSSGHLLIALDGDFSAAEPREAQLRALVELVAWASDTFDISPDALRGHDAYAATACPGTRLSALLVDGSITARVRTLLDGD